ncbi:MAG TPA: Hint domain-containing protein [Acetobacteraceae bacterium]|nr:Hint domain-containing protein [Acetobacteraceae bacterium]
MPIRQLINGATIAQVPRDQVTYYHIELSRHDVLLAENLPAESYLDTGNRGMFENAGAPLILHPDFADTDNQARRAAESCAQSADDPTRVQPVWRQLADRATQLGYTLPQIATADDPALRIVVNGRPFYPISVCGNLYTFVIPATRSGARLISRATPPTDITPWAIDRRRLGVSVTRIVLRGSSDSNLIAIDQPNLTEGWWDPEQDRNSRWRWTKGDAHIPFVAAGPSVLEAIATGTGQYRLEGDSAGAVQIPGEQLALRASTGRG